MQINGLQVKHRQRTFREELMSQALQKALPSAEASHFAVFLRIDWKAMTGCTRPSEPSAWLPPPADSGGAERRQGHPLAAPVNRGVRVRSQYCSFR